MEYNKINPSLLSSVSPPRHALPLRVYVSRKWEFRGRNDDEDLQSINLVLIDEKGTPIHAQIPQKLIPKFDKLVEERTFVYLRKLNVHIDQRRTHKPVCHKFYLTFHSLTEVAVLNGAPEKFPKQTCYLTEYSKLPRQNYPGEYFLDVIGRIVAISDCVQKTSRAGITCPNRIIRLANERSEVIEISLLGHRAEEFNGESVYKIGQEGLVIAIFVGMTPKLFKNSNFFLSGTSACRWYINDLEIPDIDKFSRRCSQVPEPVQKIEIDQIHHTIHEATLAQLKDVDPFDDQNARFECTFTIVNFIPNSSWYYASCPDCTGGTKQDKDSIICKSEGKIISRTIYRYKVCVIGDDGTAQARFMFFDERGIALVRKTAAKILSATTSSSTPLEISSLIGEKITAIVRLLSNTIPDTDVEAETFEVLFIKKRHGREAVGQQAELFHLLSVHQIQQAIALF